MKKKIESLDNFRHRKVTLKVKKLQTAEDQKQFQVGRQFVPKEISPDFTCAFIYILIVLGDHSDPPQFNLGHSKSDSSVYTTWNL